MKTQIIIACRFLIVMTLLTGIIYPLCITIFAQMVFPVKANGSLIVKNGKIIGSELLAQKSDSSIYFWSRPSAVDYNPIPSGGTNYGPTSKVLQHQVSDRRRNFVKMNNLIDTMAVPKEMVFASGSGLDPHISPLAAYMQVNRIVKARNFTIDQKQKLIHSIKLLSEGLQYSFLGEVRVNVLLLNLEVDKL